jgi:hypothetical protein
LETIEKPAIEPIKPTVDPVAPAEPIIEKELILEPANVPMTEET